MVRSSLPILLLSLSALQFHLSLGNPIPIPNPNPLPEANAEPHSNPNSNSPSNPHLPHHAPNQPQVDKLKAPDDSWSHSPPSPSNTLDDAFSITEISETSETSDISDTPTPPTYKEATPSPEWYTPHSSRPPHGSSSSSDDLDLDSDSDSGSGAHKAGSGSKITISPLSNPHPGSHNQDQQQQQQQDHGYQKQYDMHAIGSITGYDNDDEYADGDEEDGGERWYNSDSWTAYGSDQSKVKGKGKGKGKGKSEEEIEKETSEDYLYSDSTALGGGKGGGIGHDSTPGWMTSTGPSGSSDSHTHSNPNPFDHHSTSDNQSGKGEGKTGSKGNGKIKLSPVAVGAGSNPTYSPQPIPHGNGNGIGNGNPINADTIPSHLFKRSLDALLQEPQERAEERALEPQVQERSVEPQGEAEERAVEVEVESRSEPITSHAEKVEKRSYYPPPHSQDQPSHSGKNTWDPISDSGAEEEFQYGLGGEDGEEAFGDFDESEQGQEASWSSGSGSTPGVGGRNAYPLCKDAIKGRRTGFARYEGWTIRGDDLSGAVPLSPQDACSRACMVYGDACLGTTFNTVTKKCHLKGRKFESWDFKRLRSSSGSGSGGSSGGGRGESGYSSGSGYSTGGGSGGVEWNVDLVGGCAAWSEIVPKEMDAICCRA